MKVLTCILFIFFISWAVNLYKFTECDFSELNRCLVIRGIGIVPLAPLGVVMGPFTLEEEE